MAQRSYQASSARNKIGPKGSILRFTVTTATEHEAGEYKREARCSACPRHHELLPLLSP
jgi:hypothetical protein